MEASEQNKHTANTKPLAYALGIIGMGLCVLAAALYHFTMEMAAWRNQIPELSANIDKIMDRVPETVEKVDKIRETVDGVVIEVGEVRKMIPSILDEVEKVRQEIPGITRTVNDVNANVPLVVNEVKLTREAMPGILDRTEKIVTNVEEASKKAGEEALTGAVKGVITAPVKAVKKVLPGKKENASENESP